MFNSFTGRTTTSESINPDGTITTTTITYNLDGTKSTKRSTSQIIPENDPRNLHGKPAAASAFRKSRALANVPTSLQSSLLGVMDMLEEVLGVQHADNPVFEKKVVRCIPSTFLLLASQDDVTQAQEDYYAMDHYKLGHVWADASSTTSKINKTGSVATCALLQLLYENPKRFLPHSTQPWDCRQLIQEIKSRVTKASSVSAKPTISSSRPLGPPAFKPPPATAITHTGDYVYAPFYIVPPGFTGTRRALLIGVVAGHDQDHDDLRGPPNDISNIQQFLVKHAGFAEKNMIVLRDDYKHQHASKLPTRNNILKAFGQLAQQSKPKDVVFIQYTGHGGKIGNNLCWYPSDYETAGHILDEEILRDLIKYMPAQVYTTMLVDCCYSGTIGDLPYVLQSDTKEGDCQDIESYYDVNTRQEMMEKETQQDPDYQDHKNARSKWRHVMRLPSVAKEYAHTFARDASQFAHSVGHSASTAAATAASNASAAWHSNTSYSSQKSDADGTCSTASTSKSSPSNPPKPGLARSATATATTPPSSVNVSANQPTTSRQPPPPPQQQSQQQFQPALLRRTVTAPPTMPQTKKQMPPTKRAQSPIRRPHSPLRIPSTAPRSPTKTFSTSNNSKNETVIGSNIAPRSPRSYALKQKHQPSQPSQPSNLQPQPQQYTSRATAKENANNGVSHETVIGSSIAQRTPQPYGYKQPESEADANATVIESNIAQRSPQPYGYKQPESELDAGATVIGSSIAPRSPQAYAMAKRPGVARCKTVSDDGRGTTTNNTKFPMTRNPPRRSRTVQESAMEQELHARKRAVEGSKKEAAEVRKSASDHGPTPQQHRQPRIPDLDQRTPQRGRTPPRRTKTLEEIAQEQDERARRQAVVRSRKEATEARKNSRSPIRTTLRTKSMEDVAWEQEENARRQCVERSKVEAAEELARKQAVERSKMEAAAARRDKSPLSSR